MAPTLAGKFRYSAQSLPALILVLIAIILIQKKSSSNGPKYAVTNSLTSDALVFTGTGAVYILTLVGLMSIPQPGKSS